MSVKIISTGACFIINNKQSVFYLAKSHIRMLSIVRGDTIKIETSEYPDQNIFFPFKEVIIPEFETAPLLLSWMNSELPVLTGGGGGQQGLATEATLLLLLAEFRLVKAILEKIALMIEENIGTGSIEGREPDLIDNTQEFVVYRGWADSTQSGTGLENPIWAIQKEDTKSIPISRTWVDGNKNYDNVWNDRYILNYL